MIIDNLVLVSDMHLSMDGSRARLDDVKKTGFRKFKFILDWAVDHNGIVLHAGDLSVGPRNWELLAELLNTFTDDDIFYSIYGQHDTYLYSEETRYATMLGALIRAGKIRHLYNEPTTIMINDKKISYSAYGCNYGEDVPSPFLTKDGINILVIHAPIADEALWEGQDYLDAEKFLRANRGYKIILCGDIHQKFIIEDKGRYIVNCGPMIRREATEYNLQHHPGFWVWNIKSEKMTWQEIPHEPAEMVLTRDHIELQDEKTEMLDDFIKSVKTDIVDDQVSFMGNLFAFIKENKIPREVVDQIAITIGKEEFHKREEAWQGTK